MPYRAQLKQFNKKNGFVIDDSVISNYVASTVKNQRGNAQTDEVIRERIKNVFPEVGAAYERHRQQLIMLSQARPNDAKLQEKVSQMADINEFVGTYIGMLELMADVANHEQKTANRIKGKPYKDYTKLPSFGLSGEDIAKIKVDQLDSYKYAEARKYELFEAYGIQDNRFIKEAVAAGQASYETATQDQKNKLYETHITKTLVEQRLNKPGFWWTVWKWFHPSETTAMQEYIATANSALAASKFYDDPNAVTAANDYANKGYARVNGTADALVEDFNKRATKVNENLQKAKEKRDAAEALEKAEVRKRKQENKEKEQQKKESERKAIAEVKRAETIKKMENIQFDIIKANNQKLQDRFFNVRFRPSFIKEEFEAEYDEYKKVSAIVTGRMTYGVKETFRMNAKKFTAMKNLVRSGVPLTDEQKENLNVTMFAMEEEHKLNFSQYENPVKYEEVKTQYELNQKLSEDMNKDGKNQQIAPKRIVFDNEPEKKKELE